MEENQAGKGAENDGVAAVILSFRIREGLTEKTIFKQRPEGREEASHTDTWQTNTAGEKP